MNVSTCTYCGKRQRFCHTSAKATAYQFVRFGQTAPCSIFNCHRLNHLRIPESFSGWRINGTRPCRLPVFRMFAEARSTIALHLHLSSGLPPAGQPDACQNQPLKQIVDASCFWVFERAAFLWLVSVQRALLHLEQPAKSHFNRSSRRGRWRISNKNATLLIKLVKAIDSVGSKALNHNKGGSA